jgi:hypothetical protein
MPAPPKRERALVTREGWVLVQDDPLEHAVPVLLVELGDRVVRFLYENTVTVDAGAERPLTMTSYVEEVATDEGGGNGGGPLEDG